MQCNPAVQQLPTAQPCRVQGSKNMTNKHTAQCLSLCCAQSAAAMAASYHWLLPPLLQPATLATPLPHAAPLLMLPQQGSSPCCPAALQRVAACPCQSAPRRAAWPHQHQHSSSHMSQRSRGRWQSRHSAAAHTPGWTTRFPTAPGWLLLPSLASCRPCSMQRDGNGSAEGRTHVFVHDCSKFKTRDPHALACSCPQGCWLAYNGDTTRLPAFCSLMH